MLVHGEKKTVTVGGEAIARYVDKAFPGPALAKDPKVVDSFFKLVADVAHDDLVHGFYLKSGHPGAQRAACGEIGRPSDAPPTDPPAQWPRWCCRRWRRGLWRG